MAFPSDAHYQRLNFVEDGLQKNPDDVALLVEKAYLLFHPFFETQEALERLEHAAKIEPRNIDVLFWKAKILYHNLADDQGAKEALEQALKIDPRQANCLQFLSGILRELDLDQTRILALLKKAIDSE